MMEPRPQSAIATSEPIPATSPRRHVAIEGSWGFTDPIASWCARLISGDAQPDDEPSDSTVGAASSALGEVVQLGQDLR